MTKNRKVFIGSLVVLFLVGIVVAFTVQNQKVKAEEERMRIVQENETIVQETQTLVAGLYASEKKEALSDSLSKEKITDAEEQAKKVKDEELKSSLLEEIHQVSALLDTKLLIDELLENYILIDHINEANVESMNQAYTAAKELNETIALTFAPTVDEINSQMDAMKTAHQKVSSLFSDADGTTVKEDVTRNQYVEAKTSVDSIKNAQTKETLTTLLSKVDSALTEKEEKAKAEAMAAEKAKAEEKKKQEEQAATSPQTSQTAAAPAPSSPSQATPKNTAQPTLADLVASSSTAKKTNQIVTVVASGTSAKVTLFEKSGDTWKSVISSNGFVGQKGIGKAHEGSRRTPKGSYSLGFAFGTSNPGTQLPFRKITPNSYWISNVNDPQYNTWQERESSDPADEHLQNYTTAYQYAIVINYNNGVGGGSAFFLHVSTGRPTLGCVAVPKSSMVQFMQKIKPGAYIINVNNQNEITHY